jgi:hypothetical protein
MDPKTQHTETLQTIMGKQYNKIEKRRRRERYLKRKHVGTQQAKGAAKAS